MAYLILSTDGHEWDRRELRGPLVLGRSPDCDISVHDILLSRWHCRITPSNQGWLLIDLASRNGTHLRERAVEQCQLKHGDVIRVGKTKITFRADAFMPRAKPSTRPAVPPSIARDERLTGTVDGIVVPPPPSAADDDAAPVRSSMHRPSPRPRPLDPVSFTSDNLYSMLEQIASSSWDSIYATNSQPLRRNRILPQPIVGETSRPIPRMKSPVISLSLQASVLIEKPARTPRRFGRTLQRLTHMLRRVKPGSRRLTIFRQRANISGTRADG
jgi:predicted component of type VI protein secretion system